MTDILKKPVHLALLPLTHLQTLQAQGKLPKNAVSLEAAKDTDLLPREEHKAHHRVSVGAGNILAKSRMRTRLLVLYDKIPPMDPKLKPPCETCTEAPCCKAFVVEITKEEYESGLYDPYTLKMTNEIRTQLTNNIGLLTLVLDQGAPLLGRGRDSYFLEGGVGEACPFLGDDNRCTIYEDRPYVCRTFTCVGTYITEEMRTGKKPNKE